MLPASKPFIDVPAEPGVRRRRAWLWLAVGLAVICGGVWTFYPLADARARLDRVRTTGPAVACVDVPLTVTELQVLGRVDLLHRHYEVNGQRFYATVIDGTRDRHAVHDPRYCFQGAGWRVLNEGRLALPGGDSNWVHAVNGEREVQAVFWFSDGSTRYTSLLRYWWQTTLRRITLGGSGPEPVLVVLQSFGARQPDWRRFGPEVIAALEL